MRNLNDVREDLADRILPSDEESGLWADMRRLAIRTARDAKDDRVPGLAAEMAFYAILSLPPLLLAVLGSVGFVVGRFAEADIVELETQLLEALATVLSEETVEEALTAPISDLLRNGRSDVLSLGVVLTLWSASRATNVLLRTIVIAYDQDDPRPLWKRRSLAFVLTLAGIFGAVGVIPLLSLGPQLASGVARSVGLDAALSRYWPIVYWLGVVALVLLALTWLYHIAPGWETPWRRDAPGAALALGLWLAAGFGLRVYTSNLADFDGGGAFGSLAAPLVLLLWIYALAMAVLLGAELNAEIEKGWPAGQRTFGRPSISTGADAAEG